MKKKILLTTLTVVALVFVFAISAFAEDIIVSRTDDPALGTVIQLSQDPGLDNAAQYASKLNNINDAGDDEQDYSILTDGTYYYVFPSSYIVWENANDEEGLFEIYAGTDSQPGLAQAMADFNFNMGTDYYKDYTITKTGADRRLEAIVRFEFPSDVTKISKNWCCMREYPKLLEVRFNHSVNVANAEKLFYRNRVLQTVVGFEKVTGTMPVRAFAGCSVLRTVKLPTNITTIPEAMFQSCAGGLNIENFSELNQLTTIGSYALGGTEKLVITLPDSVTTLGYSSIAAAFSKGGSITINPTSQLTTIGNYAFGGNTKLSSIYIPSTVTSIGNEAFSGSGVTTLENFENCQITILNNDTFKKATKLTSIKLPKTLTTISASAFSNCSNLSLVYLPDSITSIGDTFTGSPANAVYIYTGTNINVFAECTTLANAKVIPANEYDETKTYEGVNLVVGFSNCIAYNNGNHADFEFESLVVTTYYEPIVIRNMCTECEASFDGDEIPALFRCLGYSSVEDEADAFTLGYTVNNESIAKYEELSGKTLSYGVFATTKDKLGDNDIFDENGEKTSGLTIEITEYEFVSFTLKIVGFTTDEIKAVQFAMGAYVAVTDGETTEYSYLQSGTPNENEKYSYISYNDIVKEVE